MTKLDLVSDNTDNLSVSPIEEVLEDFSQGKMVIMVDDEDRENEGDLIIAAECVTAQAINFMALHGRGLICLTLEQSRCQRLKLPLMVSNNNERYSTNFTVSIEAAEGVTTGISAADRATTVLAAVNPDAKSEDIVMPGHIFPVMAQPGGVLSRAGHTEAGVDMARISGKQAASVICEILNPDGTMARLPDLVEFGKSHEIKIGSIADLIRYRLEHEPTVLRVAQHSIETPYGPAKAMTFRDIVDNQNHLAIVFGDISTESDTLVRVHASAGVLDVFQDIEQSQSWPFNQALERISKKGTGVLVILCQNTSEQRILQQLEDYQNGTGSESSDDWRMLGIGSQILANVGVKKMRVLGTPRKMHGLSGFDLEIIEFINTP